MNFINKLITRWKSTNSLVCVGLDPDLNRIPDHIHNKEQPIFEFNRVIIDSTHDLVCAYKPQIAYYSAFGAELELELTIEYIMKKYPDIVSLILVSGIARYLAHSEINPLIIGHSSVRPSPTSLLAIQISVP